MKSFLDGIVFPPGCHLVCHDSNHNGDIDPEQGCGNSECWKHIPGSSTLPDPIRVATCRCPVGTFKEDNRS
jgi:hypothetical protein